MYVSVYATIYKCNLLSLFCHLCLWFKDSLLHIGRQKKKKKEKLILRTTGSVYFSKESLASWRSLSNNMSTPSTFALALLLSLFWTVYAIISRRDCFISHTQLLQSFPLIPWYSLNKNCHYMYLLLLGFLQLISALGPVVVFWFSFVENGLHFL